MEEIKEKKPKKPFKLFNKEELQAYKDERDAKAKAVKEQVKKVSKNKSDYSIFFIKDTVFLIFSEFIEEVKKIPKSEDKFIYIRRVLYRNNDNRAELNILIGYYIKRILFSPTIKERFLPLESDLVKDTITGKQINLPQLDFLVEYGVNEPELRPYFEEYIYSESNYLQKMLCDFINGENIFKLPKHYLKELWENKKVRMDRYMTINDKFVLHRNFIGLFEEKYQRQFYKFHDLRNHKDSKFKDRLVMPSKEELNSYHKEAGRKARAIQHWQKTLEWEHWDTRRNLAYPVFLYKGNLAKKKKLLWLVRYSGVTKTNIEGMLLCYFETVIKREASSNFTFIGFLNEDNSLSVMVLTINKEIAKAFLTDYAMQMRYNYNVLIKDLKLVRKNMKFYAEEFGVKQIRIHKQEGFVFHTLHHLLNYLLLRVAKGDTIPITIMFRNFLMLSNGVKYRKALFKKWDSKKHRGIFVYLDNKEEVELHRTRLTETVEIIPNFVGQEVFIFNFNLKAKFALLAPMKKFTWDTEEYTEKVNKLRTFTQTFEAKDRF